jgi:2-dehydro-3-deoxy-phosphogluconate/2-dehydro-3-deoxy-6-phosphogalactonate aldolase
LPKKIVPALTPFREGKVDGAKLREHVERLLKEGIDYIFLCGTTGLGPSLSAQEKLECLLGLEDHADRIIFQVGTLNLDDSLMLAREAKKVNVRAIASYPPYFYPRASEDWAVEHLTRLSKVHPLIAYNFPLATGFEISPALIKRARKQGADIIGVKDTVNDLAHMLSFKYELGSDFTVYSGPDTLILSALRSGLDGVVAGTANYVPELLVKLGDDPQGPESERTQQLITSLAGVARKHGQWAANYSLVKAIQGYDAGGPRPPVFPLGPSQEKALAEEAGAIYSRKPDA